MSGKKVFVDSDVVISSLISQKGAAHLLLNKQKANFVISNISEAELEKVANRLEINQDKLQALIKKRLKIINLTQGIGSIKKKFKDYTSDPDDAHIVAGAAKVKAKFLLTYNRRHFKRRKISRDLGVIVLTPAQYLQYLRSLE
ncbi:MAG: PIN domain-containing protein [bacterium]|nr:PIN domain-containing protein [bacterium]